MSNLEKRVRKPKGFIAYERRSDFGNYLYKSMKEKLEKSKVQSIKRLNMKYVYKEISENSSYSKGLELGSIIFFRIHIHVVISKNIYLMEKMMGIDAVSIIDQEWRNIKLTINWKE